MYMYMSIRLDTHVHVQVYMYIQHVWQQLHFHIQIVASDYHGVFFASLTYRHCVRCMRQAWEHIEPKYGHTHLVRLGRLSHKPSTMDVDDEPGGGRERLLLTGIPTILPERWRETDE